LGYKNNFPNREFILKILVILSCLIWQSVFLIYATKNFLKKRPRKEHVAQYSNIPLRQQLLIIGVMSELLHAGIDPLNAIRSGIEILEEKQRDKYLDVMMGKKIAEQDYLSNSINLILNSSITGSKISETLRLNLETYQRSHRNEVLKAIKKSEVYLLGPLGLCFLPTFMLIAVVPLIGSLVTGFMA
jgi:translation initiation factor 2 beta subunit (eIF-2beta)/eIF-5